MNPDLVREIAQQIVREELLLNWKFYTILLVLVFLASIIGNWLAAYAKKRGETFATKADMQELLEQVKTTTKVTEEVRTSVLHADWVAREWRMVRRTKLEELLNSVYELDHWLDSQQQSWIYKRTEIYDKAPMDRVKILATLYFPEMREEIYTVLRAHHSAQEVILEIATMVNAAKTDLQAYQDVMDEFLMRWNVVYPPARRAIADLECRVAKLMQEISGT